MPLSASVDDEVVCGPLMTDPAWAAMRGRSIRLLPCGHPGFPRVSPLGTRHFVHARDSGCRHAESAEHLRLKAVIAQQVADVGWRARTEVPGPGFIADVLAEGPGATVAFEVQRSRQVLLEYERRQQVYAAAGVRCVWFAAHVPAGHQAGPHLPLFQVAQWQGNPRCVVAGRSLTVTAMVRALLGGHCRWRDSVDGHTATFETLRQMCPVCGTARVRQVAGWTTGTCECGLPAVQSVRGDSWPQDARCCGYWGPSLLLGLEFTQVLATAPIAAGHWCLSAGALDRPPVRPA